MHLPTLLTLLAASLASGMALPDPTAAPDPNNKPTKVLGKRFATNVMPASSGHVVLSAATTVSVFDGGMKKYDRGVSCGGQEEGGDKDAVFLVQSGGTLKNVIIGKDQMEGVHCLGPCTIQNVWWEDVCEDALTIKQSSGTSYVVGGGAFEASDKIVQHNGAGAVSIKDFYAENFGKVYRSCGNCGTQYTRSVTMSGVWAVNGKLLAGVNSNYGDKATISGTCADGVSAICAWYQGNDDGDEPTQLGSGISDYCVYANNGVDDCP
ncbi:Pectate lyase catalytic [Lasiodiplodia theobromae]|uniref:Pectate lyase n=1 Tax=Lasiodiplodia theobromae TaxID=45133 RepID=UPI0015C32B0C|nr:Pectate lyase [Lasiodiplodia theobromae]KAF4539143.1 Pectate lyase [Lasiodiplodia theobromae]KAF9639976.1 Pectate lyase catalytic [Lasiodiplodia theobromae]